MGNRYPKQPIGSVYLQMAGEGEEIRAFNVTCPHLGCAVEYRETPNDNTPEILSARGHTSAFCSGWREEKIKIPPRDFGFAGKPKVVRERAGASKRFG